MPSFLRILGMGVAANKNSYIHKIGRYGYLFIAPALVFFSVFSFFPMFYALSISFFQYDLLTPPKYVGLENYVTLFQDPLFWNSVGATMIYVFGTCVPIWFLSLALGILLSIPHPGRDVFRTMYFIPVIMSLVVTSMIWKFMYHPYGIVNTALSYIGIKEPIRWLTHTKFAPLAMILMSIWKGTPYYAVIYLTGIQNIPTEYYEAAGLDGASRWQKFIHITWPQLKPTTLFVVIISVIIGLRVFIPQQVMTGGGPADSTRVITLMVYETAFRYFKMSKAATMSVIMFLFIAVFSIIQFKILKDRD